MLSKLIHKLAETHRLEVEEYRDLIDHRDEASTKLLAELARNTAKALFSKKRGKI